MRLYLCWRHTLNLCQQFDGLGLGAIAHALTCQFALAISQTQSYQILLFLSDGWGTIKTSLLSKKTDE